MSFKQVSVFIISLIVIGLQVNIAFAENEKEKGQLVTEERVLMGTQVIIKVFGGNRVEIDRAIEAAFAEVLRLEKLMSHYIPESELSQINQMAGKQPLVVSRELFDLIQKSLVFSEMTEGAFDISFASVGKLWSFRKKIVPSLTAVKEQLPHVNYKKIQMDDQRGSVFLTAGMEIGLGGIGKGYAIDQAMVILQEHGIKNAMVMAGGDTLVRGKKWDSPWRIGLRDPNKADGILAVLPLKDQAISTSGDYERFFMKDGVRYHHILNTRTGFPADLCRSVTILASDATTSDTLSTSVFVLGPKKGMALIEGMKDVEGIIVDPLGKVHLSSGLTAFEQNTTAKK